MSSFFAVANETADWIFLSPGVDTRVKGPETFGLFQKITWAQRDEQCCPSFEMEVGTFKLMVTVLLQIYQASVYN